MRAFYVVSLNKLVEKNRRVAGELKSHDAFPDVSVVSLIISSLLCVFVWYCSGVVFAHDDAIKWKKHSALLALWAVTGEFPPPRPVTGSFDVFFDLRRDKRLSQQSRRRWFETPLCSLWLHCNAGSTISLRDLLDVLQTFNIKMQIYYVYKNILLTQYRSKLWEHSTKLHKAAVMNVR